MFIVDSGGVITKKVNSWQNLDDDDMKLVFHNSYTSDHVNCSNNFKKQVSFAE